MKWIIKKYSWLETPLYDHVGKPHDTFYQCYQLELSKNNFTIANRFIFHRSLMRDAHVISI